jgi:hypothetical protein
MKSIDILCIGQSSVEVFCDTLESVPKPGKFCLIENVSCQPSKGNIRGDGRPLTLCRVKGETVVMDVHIDYLKVNPRRKVDGLLKYTDYLNMNSTAAGGARG